MDAPALKRNQTTPSSFPYFFPHQLEQCLVHRLTAAPASPACRCPPPPRTITYFHHSSRGYSNLAVQHGTPYSRGGADLCAAAEVQITGFAGGQVTGSPV
ncbi:unnamed protein product [Arctogadus glacialis]